MQRPRRLLATITALVTVLTLTPTGAVSAGGWAVTTLDPLPAMRPGATVDIGFTVRQHGVTPVDLRSFSADPVGIAVVDDAGERAVFDAAASGAVGHYVARVHLPPAGSYRWEVLQGPFAPHALGSLELAAAASSQAPAADDTLDAFDAMAALRWSAIGLAAAIGVVAATQLVRRRSVSPDAAAEVTFRLDDQQS